MLFLPSVLLSLVAALGLAWFTRKNPARDPRVTGAVLLLMLILPLLGAFPQHLVEVETTNEFSTLAHTSSKLTWTPFLIAIWIGGVGLFGLKALADLLAFRRWKKQASHLALPIFETAKAELSFSQTASLMTHPELSSPVVAGLIRPVIYLPEDANSWPEATLKMALLHELGHLQRRDLWMATAARMTCIFHWFNPLSWWLRKALLSQCEYACDAHLMKHGTDRRVYAHALCDVAEAKTAPPLALAMAGHVPLKERILQLNQPRHSRSLLLTAIFTLTGGSAVALSVINFVPKQATPSPMETEIQLRLTANPFPLD